MTERKSDPAAPPHIFDEALLSVRADRAARRRAGSDSFLLTRMVEDLAERLTDVNRRFETALLIAPDGAEAALRARLPQDRTPTTFIMARPTHHTKLGVEPESVDVALALIGPGQVNDLPGALIEMRQAVRPDGLLIAALFGGATLTELRQALYADDQSRRDGLTPRIHPTVDHQQAAQLLSRAGLAMPVVDKDRFTVRYGALSTLINDLRDLGLTNALVSRDPAFLGRDALTRIAAQYPREDDKHPATFEILWLTGWAPDASQPKPLKPGSAKMRLADVLGTKETKL